jgi:hypothetical protein
MIYLFYSGDGYVFRLIEMCYHPHDICKFSQKHNGHV